MGPRISSRFVIYIKSTTWQQRDYSNTWVNVKENRERWEHYLFFYTIHSEYCIIQVLQALISLIHEIYILCSWREKERNREIKTKSRGDRFFTQLHFLWCFRIFFLNQISFTHDNICIGYYGYTCLMEMTLFDYIEANLKDDVEIM